MPGPSFRSCRVVVADLDMEAAAAVAAEVGGLPLKVT